MATILYLGLEGVCFARKCDLRYISKVDRGTGCRDPLPLIRTIAAVANAQPELSFVLNSCLVQDLGYRHIINSLPIEIAAKTVGATMLGNRVHRRPNTVTRVDALRGDIRRRNPANLLIVDASQTAIPYEWLDHAIHIDSKAQRDPVATLQRILTFLDSASADDGQVRPDHASEQ
ncbi:hypothetical protein AWB80_01336 [Caballeronia pedi]|uniref:Uncharacterized protein n=1 Tax=Caballeronia pedi TaxID=1777141 RepID=A0A157ZUZ0_9BURK|nr:hypothetical protein [Caballeronia pedi]SAK49352.1 hypothetical protein AWB80_01336 [Caballeronia pedi]